MSRVVLLSEKDRGFHLAAGPHLKALTKKYIRHHSERTYMGGKKESTRVIDLSTVKYVCDAYKHLSKCLPKNVLLVQQKRYIHQQ